jgi:hypothetical protein
MQFDLITVVYIAGGLILPLFYLPQIRRCHLDNSGLASFSMTKTAVMTVLRLAMLPFVLRVGNDVMSFIVMLDTAGRLLELLAAVRSLRRQGWSSSEIVLRMLPSLQRARSTAAAGTDAATAPRAAPTFSNTVPALDVPPSARISSGFMYLDPTPLSKEPPSAGDDEHTATALAQLKGRAHTPA